ncbi:MAG TPA: hypothetical protein VKU03_11700, partial [Roseiarcus sp.]|nr:hypothetical protein [Roseiarcus sp.]
SGSSGMTMCWRSQQLNVKGGPATRPFRQKMIFTEADGRREEQTRRPVRNAAVSCVTDCLASAPSLDLLRLHGHGRAH